MQAHLLASLLQPLVESDCSLLEPHRKAWLRRDRLFATRMLLRHLAAAVNRERPQFTLVDNHATDEVLMHSRHAFTSSRVSAAHRIFDGLSTLDCFGTFTVSALNLRIYYNRVSCKPIAKHRVFEGAKIRCCKAVVVFR